MLEKFKRLLSNNAVYYSLMIVLVSIASFGLGRQSVLIEGDKKGFVEAEGVSLISTVPEPIAVTSPVVSSVQISTSQPAVAAGAMINGAPIGEQVVASKSGKKYHLPTCAGAKAIKPENLITFNSRAEAEAAGYTPAANCKGLQ